MADEDTLKILKEILAWTRVGFYRIAKESLEEILDSDKKKLAYQAMDGSKTLDVIKSELKMGKADLVELFRRCEYSGVMAQIDGKRRRCFDLENFGLLPNRKKNDAISSKDARKNEAKK